MGKIKDLTGKKFGNLTVIKLSAEKTKWGGTIWVCICDCGKYIESPSSNLIKEKTKNCGCLRKRQKLPYGEASFNDLYARYIRSAEKRGYNFTLSKEDFKGLTKQNCYYCGKYPSQEVKNNSKINGYYEYNGIDRLNNEIGYTIDNCVPCCKLCNFSKHNMSVEEFKKHITTIYNNFINPSLENLIQSN